MPRYDLSLIIRMMPRSSVVEAVKRTAESLYDRGAVIRKIEYLGTRALPFKRFSNSVVHYHGNYFLIDFHGAHQWQSRLLEDYIRDLDILNARIHIKNVEQPVIECTLEDELKPPAYRPSVKTLLETKKKKSPLFKKFELVKKVYPI